jgi:hypothetical protein
VAADLVVGEEPGEVVERNEDTVGADDVAERMPSADHADLALR